MTTWSDTQQASSAIAKGCWTELHSLSSMRVMAYTFSLLTDFLRKTATTGRKRISQNVRLFITVNASRVLEKKKKITKLFPLSSDGFLLCMKYCYRCSRNTEEMFFSRLVIVILIGTIH